MEDTKLGTLMVGAMDNVMELLGKNRYPGRGIVLGTSQDGVHAVQIYWIMGRSENSRNRIFRTDGIRLFTEAADPSKVKDPSLIIYNAMDVYRGDHVVSNGNQTDTIIDQIKTGNRKISDALLAREYEPDAPNFTPRITGICSVASGVCSAELSILRKSNFVTGDQCERHYYEYGQIIPGFGFCVTTYNSDGNPLPSFTGEPFSVLVSGSIDEVAESYWSFLNVENRISLAVKFIGISSGASEIRIINRFTKVEESTTA